ncbi:MAG TPA: zinc-dependent alcohol dehydrogenase family protein [Polyangia bacterium]|nr:zinc-dependent alcohol dehydrogenase family protein [Polyangia bacterium]
MGVAMVLREPATASAEAGTPDAPGRPLLRETREPPAPGPGIVSIQLGACGVCRTDLQLCEGDLKARHLPIVPGHQAVGRIVAVGDGVQGWKLGDRAGVAWLAGTCGVCDKCRSGRENLCAQATFTGWDVDGGYATHLTARADFALPIPDGFDDVAAAPLLCGGVIGYRSLARSGIAPGGRLGLYGFGASALITIQVARHWGCRVFVVTRSPAEQERARLLGAEWTGGLGARPPEPLDAAITFAPSGDVVRAALQAVDRGGTVAINAIHLDRIPQLPYEELWWERRLASVANFTRQDATALLRLAAEIPIRTEVDCYPLSHANLALAALRDGRVKGAAVLLPES